MNKQHIPTESKQFTELADVYDTINPLSKDGKFWIEQIEKLTPQTIIDFGCGTGLLTCDLAERGYAMIGIDPAAPMVDVARAKNCNGDIEWIAGGYEEIVGKKADLFLMTSHVAQFFLKDEDWRQMIQNAYNALNPNGYILFDSRRTMEGVFESWPQKESPHKVVDPNKGEIQYWVEVLEKTQNTAKYELHYYFTQTGNTIISTDTLIFRTKEEIEQVLSDIGFNMRATYGNWDTSPYTDTSPEMIFLAQR